MGYLHHSKNVACLWGLLVAVTAHLSCSGERTQRIVETPAGESVVMGEPHEWTYSAEVLPERDALELRVTRSARCARIPVTVLQRVQETLEGDEVVATEPLGPRQSSGPTMGEVPCEQGFARDSEVSLRIGDEVFSLGTTDARGTVRAGLSERLEHVLYREDPVREATVLVRGPRQLQSEPVASVALESLARHEAYVGVLLKRMRRILETEGDLSGADAQRLYVLYERLRRVAPNSSEFRGASVRFWEVIKDRRERQRTRSLTRNLKALSDARALLKDAGFAALPLYVRAAVNDGDVEPEAVEWAEWELLSGLVASPVACSGEFAWRALPTYGLSPQATLAARYLQFAFGNGYDRTARGFCKRFKQ